jgi:hypothetical protein
MARDRLGIKSVPVPIKGIFSQDFEVCFWYQSKDLKFLPLQSMFFCFLNLVFVSNISIFSRLVWAIRHENRQTGYENEI